MLRQLLLPALAFTLLATEAATAQTASAAPQASRPAYRKARKAERVLTKREQQAAARAQAASQTTTAAAPAGNTTWSGWSNEPLPFTPEPAAPHRATGANVSVAPGIPLNQVGHGVSTDYDGRPLKTAVASTTLSAQR